MNDNPLLLDSITDATDDARGRVVVSGSHGGMYPAALASQANVRSVLFNDAGIGLDKAGIAGVLALADVGMAAAAVDCKSSRIGSARDLFDHGRINIANRVAHSLGVTVDMSVVAALDILKNAPLPDGRMAVPDETRRRLRLKKNGIDVVLVDSASLIGPEDVDQIVITGSHGGLVGGDPKRALKVRARIAVFNDAGFTDDDIAASRLPALDHQGVAAVLVSCQTARIGNALSALETGAISYANTLAVRSGARQGLRLKSWLECF